MSFNKDSKYKVIKDNKFGYKKISPLPSLEEINKYYSEEFYDGDFKLFNDSSKEVQLQDIDQYKMWWDHIWDVVEIEANKNNLQISSAIDIGCGWGLMLIHYVRSKKIYGYGFDPAPEAIEYLKENGVDGIVSGFEDLKKLDRKFDTVFMINVLEHLIDPIDVIQQINLKMLDKNGMLIIDVPNEYNVLQVAGQKLHNLPEWWIAPPRHLNYFSLQSLENILSETGFEVFHYESSFPLEMFLLFGENYVSDQNIGKKIHNSRVNFEMNLVKSGNSKTLFNLYHDFAKQGIGRQIRVYAKKIKNANQ